MSPSASGPDWQNWTAREVIAFNNRVNGMLVYDADYTGFDDWTRWRSILARGRAACLGFALVKMGLLRDEGFGPDQVALIINDAPGTDRDHATVGLRLPWAILRLGWRVTTFKIG